jgi:hypothetical protein
MTKPSEFKGRYIAEAYKYDINHLIVVAGPSGSGTQAFADRLIGGGLAPVENELGLSMKGAQLLPAQGNGRIPVAVMTYDILNTFMRTGSVYGRDVELDLLSSARQVTFLTLRPKAESLAAAYGPLMGKGKFIGGPSKREKRILETYLSEEGLQRHYGPWLEFARASDRKSLVVELGAGDEIIRISEG